MIDAGLRHQALFYDSDIGFADSLTAFVRAGLALGDTVVVALSVDRTALLAAALGVHATDVRFVDAEQWYQSPMTALAEYDRCLADGLPGRVRLVGEPAWPKLWPEDWAQYESVMNVAFATTDAFLLCPYDVRLGAGLLDDARRTHPEMADGANPAYVDPTEFHASANGRALDPAPAGAEWSDFGPRGLRDVRVRLTADAELAGLRPDRVAHLVCAVNEVATNAVQHGGGSGLLRCWTDGDLLVCEVSSFGAFTAPFPGFVPPRRDLTSGRGLWLARQLCDLVQIRTQDGRSLVRLTMHV